MNSVLACLLVLGRILFEYAHSSLFGDGAHGARLPTGTDNVRAEYRIGLDSNLGLQATYTDPINAVFNAQSNQPEYEGQFNWNHTFSPNMTNQAATISTLIGAKSRNGS